MLLVDGCPNTVEDLRAQEAAILDIASTERIDLKTKLALAQEEVSEEVLDFLVDQGRAHDPAAGSRRRMGVSDVVVTRQLKRWHAMHTILMVYRDALHNQLNARYGEQYRQYIEIDRQARLTTERFGIGVVYTPIPRASQPVFSAAVRPVPAATYYIRVSWVGSGGAEGEASWVTAYEAIAGSVPEVGVVDTPAGVTGFNVYVGLSATEPLALQNSTPVPVGETFVVPDALASGRAPGNGQEPDVWVTGARVLRRG